MDKNYSTYTADQLLNDNFFIQSELHPTEKSLVFWKDIQKKNVVLSEEIENARLLLHTIKNIDKNCSSLSDKDEHALWQRIELKNREVDKKLKRRTLIRITIGMAASLLLLVAIGKFTTQHPEETKTNYQAILQSNQNPDNTNPNVQLILSNKEKLTIDGTETKLEYKKEGKIKVNSEQVSFNTKEDQEQKFNQLIVPTGRRSSIIFADGTQLWVNSGSKVVYPVKFAKEKREIFVEGEIYLHVSQDEQKPFIVKTNQMDIKVLGTQFNVMAYKNEVNMQVVLVSGKVEVNLGNKCKNILAPNQMFSYNSNMNKGKISTVDTDDYVAWKDGYYQFHQQPLKEIVKKLSRYYGVHIYCEAPADKLSCSGKLDLKESLDKVMKALKEAAPIQIENKYESVEIKVKH